MSLLASTASDSLVFAIDAATIDLLDIGQTVITETVGLRCGTVRCGTSRCGFGGVYVVVPADPFLNAAALDSP